MSSLFGGGGSTPESMASILKAMEKYFPGTLASVQSTYPGEAAAQYDIARQYSPLYAQLQADTLRGPGMELAEAGRELSRAEQLGAAQTELDIARGPGRQIAQEALSLQELVDPEFFQQRGALSDALTKTLGAVDPNQLTPAETEQISRGIGRTQYAVGSPTQDAMSVLTFGDALSKRRQEFNAAIDRATAALPQLRTGFSGFEAATRRTLMPNYGVNAYTGVQAPGVQTASQTGQNTLNMLGNIENTRVGKQKDWLDMINSFGSAAQGLGQYGLNIFGS